MKKEYFLNLEHLSLFYPKSDLEIMKKYSPFEWVRNEYYNYGFGDSGYYVYVKYNPEMEKENWFKNFIETKSVGMDGLGLLKFDSCELIDWEK